MPELPPILLAGLTGLISGLLLSIPVGPINLTILNEGARRGFKWAALIGLGATVMEVIYCFIAFTGFASFFTRGYVKAAMELFSFVFMLFIGMKFMLAKSVQARPVASGGGGEQDRGAARRTAAPAFGVHDRAGAGDGQCGGAGVLDHPGGQLHFARMGHARLAGQAGLRGGRGGGHGRVVYRAELGGVARPRQTQREDPAADGTLLRRGAC